MNFSPRTDRLIKLNKRFPYRIGRWIVYTYLRLESKLNKCFRKSLSYIFAERFIIKGDKLSLDIGCGVRGEGDVNIDLYIEKNIHRRYVSINVKKYENFIIADAQLLPFRNNAFHVSICAFVLEHLEAPIKAIKEMERVVRELSIIKVQSPIDFDLTPSHLYTWSPSTFYNLIKRVFRDAKVVLAYDELIGIGVK